MNRREYPGMERRTTEHLGEELGGGKRLAPAKRNYKSEK
jgi:hypothetical protein